MRFVMPHLLSVLSLLLGLEIAQARDSVLNAIPADALGFAVVHNLTDASRNVDELAQLVQAPAPDLLRLAKRLTDMQSGLDEQGDAAIVLTSIDPAPKLVVLAPVANFAEFFAAHNVEDPAPGIVQVQLAGAATLIGRKGDFAALAPAADRDALEQFLASRTSPASDERLAEWLAANKASVVVTPRGIKQLLPKLISGIREAQAQIRAAAGANGNAAADGLDLYAALFTAAESEVEQFSLGLRIDSAQTVDVMTRVQFTPGGSWTQWAAISPSPDEDLLAGFPAGPFVIAVGGDFPSRAMDGLMKFAVQLMQNQPGFQLTPKQAREYVELSTSMMHSVRSMRMVLGVPEPGTGLYGNTSVVMLVDDSQRFLEEYEQSLSAMSQLAQETKSPVIPAAKSQRIPLGETEALEVTTDLPDMSVFTPPGGPDMQKIMQLMFGANGKLMVYVAPADEHAILMTYTSLERLQAALDFYRSNQPGLSDDSGVAKVAAALPASCQFVACVSLGGVTKIVQQFASMLPEENAPAIPDFPDCPPLGIAAKVAPLGVEGHLIVTAETLRAIGDVVAKAHAAVPDPRPPQP